MRGGPAALADLVKLGEQPGEEDLPQPLEWESPLWELYRRLSSQRIAVFSGYRPVDYAVLLPQIERRGWQVDMALDLLDAIVETEFEHSREQAEANG